MVSPVKSFESNNGSLYSLGDVVAKSSVGNENFFGIVLFGVFLSAIVVHKFYQPQQSVDKIYIYIHQCNFHFSILHNIILDTDYTQWLAFWHL